MDNISQARFDELVRKDLNVLTEDDIQFLRARRSYLSEEQAANFAPILETEPAAPKEKPLERMNLAELQEVAAKLQVETKDADGKDLTKKDLVTAIQAARDAQQPQ